MKFEFVMAEDFFKSLLTGNFIDPPELVNKELYMKFPHAINVEWMKDGAGFEAVFYEHETEKIARFSAEGDWFETYTNLEISALDEPVGKSSENYGEIMNAIRIDSREGTKFELIVRDNNLKRYLLIIMPDGAVKSHELIT
ncbi:MAG: hypothetical protein JXB00_04100 [Bacteroidales bacterium]|nr:hypothetical protein [Bacteroidales bacterium]